jgi:Ca2+-binding RTX toxin-like protein
MRSHRGLTAGVVGIAAIASLALAAPSFGAVSCAFSASDHLLSVSAPDAFTKVARDRQRIQVDDGHELVSCAGGSANVQNTDLIQVSHAGRSAATVDLSGGPFEPGLASEPLGSPEIEFEFLGQTFLDVRGTMAADRFAFGAGGVNLNGDDDTDVTGSFTVILVEGRGGDDLIGPQSGYAKAAGRRVLLGGEGRDTLIATPDGAFLHGGDGRDRLTGGGGRDNLTGGRGNDLISGGKGRDLIRAIDGRRDRVSCGAGLDRAKVDGIDRLKGCERLIAVKRRGPVKRRPH